MLLKIRDSDNSKDSVPISVMMGAVYFFHGVQKSLGQAVRRARCFEKISLPLPDFSGRLFGICGILAASELLTRFACIPVIKIMFTGYSAGKGGAWADEGLGKLLHGSKTDLAMLLGSIFLLITGGGNCSAAKILIDNAA